MLFFVPLFAWGLARPGLFWWWMSAVLLVLNGIVLAMKPGIRQQLASDFSRGVPGKTALGLVSAAVLYAAFLAGRRWLAGLFPAAGQHIASVYLLRPALPAWLIAFLLTAVIAPGEELFWRIYLQNEIAARYGPATGCLLGALIYAGVHAGGGNPVLVVAALVCGLFWGVLYLRFRSFLLNAFSHAVWDLVIFLLAPLG